MAINYMYKRQWDFRSEDHSRIVNDDLSIPQVEFVNGGKSFTLTTISTSG